MAVDVKCPKCGHINIYAVSMRTDDGGEYATGWCIECGHTWERRVVVLQRGKRRHQPRIYLQP